jgi:hypothetical protein
VLQRVTIRLHSSYIRSTQRPHWPSPQHFIRPIYTSEQTTGNFGASSIHRSPTVKRLSPSHLCAKHIRMVLTPVVRATELLSVSSPLILPVDRSSSASSSVHSASPPWTASYPPPLRKNSTGSFSKLSDFRLDPEPEEEEEGNGVEGVRHVGLSVDAQ